MVAERPTDSEFPEKLAVHTFSGLDDSLLPEDKQAEDVARALEFCKSGRLSGRVRKFAGGQVQAVGSLR